MLTCHELHLFLLIKKGTIFCVHFTFFFLFTTYFTDSEDEYAIFYEDGQGHVVDEN
jgi:hypothetical protein